MRLPAFLTNLSPVGETLAAVEQGQLLLEQEVSRRNDQLSVGTADEALSRWKADYSLPDGTGKKEPLRRARIRTAMGGGQCLNRSRLRDLCISIGGADDVEIEEDFPNWCVSVTALYEGRFPEEQEELRRAFDRLKPAHLQMVLAGESLLQSAGERYLAHVGSVFLVLDGRESA